MAGSHGGFDSIAQPPVDRIREALRRTMVLGLPETESERPTFYFERVNTWDRFDSEGNPWDWTAAPVSSSQKAPVQPVCAYEFFSPLGRQGIHETEVGEFQPTTLVVTLLEDEFQEVSGFTYLTVGPGSQKWYFRYWRPAYSIADMTVYQIHCAVGDD